MQFALLIYAASGSRAEVGPEPGGGTGGMVDYFRPFVEAGAFIAAEGLHDVDTATSVRLSGGELVLTDGPFAETKEHLLGFFLIEAVDLDSAIGWAAKMPVLRRGTVEIRPLLAASADSAKVGQRGPEPWSEPAAGAGLPVGVGGHRSHHRPPIGRPAQGQGCHPGGIRRGRSNLAPGRGAARIRVPG